LVIVSQYDSYILLSISLDAIFAVYFVW